MYRNSPSRFAIQLSVVCMAMESDGCPMAIDDFGQTRTAQIRPNLRGFAAHGFGDGSIMGHDNNFARPQHRKGSLQFESFIEPGLDEALHLLFAKSCQYAPAKSTVKSFGPGKTDAVPFVTASVQNLDAFAA